MSSSQKMKTELHVLSLRLGTEQTSRHLFILLSTELRSTWKQGCTFLGCGLTYCLIQCCCSSLADLKCSNIGQPLSSHQPPSLTPFLTQIFLTPGKGWSLQILLLLLCISRCLITPVVISSCMWSRKLSSYFHFFFLTVSIVGISRTLLWWF